ncbi:MAG: 50S ribosomal protein L9 [Alphaproteobacteria bacterium]|nr:50S ribosomal protein L9 [Alphaproteobacteria bacterium]
MEVILLERVEKLGQMGARVKVRDGYARNYLLPQNKALRATKENVERFEKERVRLEAQNLERRTDAMAMATKMDNVAVTLLRQAADTTQLYGSVNARDIAQAVSEAGFAIDRRQVMLEQPIKSLGVHKVRVALHPEVSVSVSVNVARSEAEAEQQAQGGAPAQPEAFFEEGALPQEEDGGETSEGQQ